MERVLIKSKLHYDLYLCDLHNYSGNFCAEFIKSADSFGRTLLLYFLILRANVLLDQTIASSMVQAFQLVYYYCYGNISNYWIHFSCFYDL